MGKKMMMTGSTVTMKKMRTEMKLSKWEIFVQGLESLPKPVISKGEYGRNPQEEKKLQREQNRELQEQERERLIEKVNKSFGFSNV